MTGVDGFNGLTENIERLSVVGEPVDGPLWKNQGGVGRRAQNQPTIGASIGAPEPNQETVLKTV